MAVCVAIIGKDVSTLLFITFWLKLKVNFVITA